MFWTASARLLSRCDWPQTVSPVQETSMRRLLELGNGRTRAFSLLEVLIVI